MNTLAEESALDTIFLLKNTSRLLPLPSGTVELTRLK